MFIYVDLRSLSFFTLAVPSLTSGWGVAFLSLATFAFAFSAFASLVWRGKGIGIKGGTEFAGRYFAKGSGS